ncbi:MAG: 2-C-methyl-D-erythritol 4-phosphate cytidylyltransferase [Abditibacteriaceae bacterium]
MTTQTLTAIIPAAGCGARAGLNSNKILAPLAGHTVLGMVLSALASAKILLKEHDFNLTECVIAARQEEFCLVEEVSAMEKLPFTVRLVEGGEKRQHSVLNAVQSIGSDWVMIHDAARPLVSPELIASVCQAARRHDGAIAALPATDTIKYSTPNEGQPFIKSTFERDRVWLAQTPQVFPRLLFMHALKSAEQANFEGTDCASLMERLGQKVALVLGEACNFKITYAEDLERAERELKI